MSDNHELTVFDIADWVWSFRLLAVFMLCLAVVWACISGYSALREATQEKYELTARVLPSGTPIRSADDIVSIVASHLQETDTLQLNPESIEKNLIFTTGDKNQAYRALDTIQRVNLMLIQEVNDRSDTIYSITGNKSDAIINQELKTKSFSEALRSGLLKIISAEIVAQRGSILSPTVVRSVALPFATCILAFFSIALGTSFARAWRQRKT